MSQRGVADGAKGSLVCGVDARISWEDLEDSALVIACDKLQFAVSRKLIIPKL